MSEMLSFHLPDSFIEGYERMVPDWGFPIGAGQSLAELIYVDKYSALKEDGTKERWHETVRRCIEGYYSILKDHCKGNRTPWNDFKAMASAKDAYDRMYHFKWLPPGRGLQHMGRPIVHEEGHSSALQNCFSGSERFIAEDGTHAFNESVGMEFKVLTRSGFRNGVVSSFGEQDVQLVTFKPYKLRTNIRHTVKVTPDHRWILADGTETTNLSVGDHVSSVLPEFATGDDYRDGLLHGVIYGDGGKTSHRYSDGRWGFELRACDSRTEEVAQSLKDRWHQIYTDRPSGDGDTFYFVKSAIDFKEFPVAPTMSYAMGFFEGWIAADGHIKPSGAYALDCQDPASVKFVEDYSALAGFQLIGHSVNSSDTNFGARKNPLNRFTLLDSTEKPMHEMCVESIISLDEKEEVFCLTVPSAGEFVLANGILTGNCAFLSTAKLTSHSVEEAILPFTRMMEMSMWGVGVGYDLKGAGNLTLHEPNREKLETFVVPDSREGWAESLGKLLESFFFKNRPVVDFDYSEVRPAGSPLKRFGGRASGPGPLIALHESLRAQLDKREGEAITSIDILDIMNKVGKAVVAGGARRSAQICFGSPDDTDYVNAKDWNLSANAERTDPVNGWAWNSNNSVFVNEGDDYSAMVNGIVTNGEPGFMWLELARSHGRLVDPRNDRDWRVAGGNPCLEQSLEDKELCTLVEVFPSKHSDYEDFRESLKHAYLYGKAVTLLPTKWADSNEVMARNRRIGCSISGLAQFVETKGWAELRRWADEGYKFVEHRDQKYSEWLAVRESIKKTSIKPSGTVSLVAGVTPGVHWPTASGSYIRRVRYSVNNPLVDHLKKAGYDIEPAEGDPENTVVATFITKGPDVRDERQVTIWEKAELAAMMQRYWADNQVSATITFLPDEQDQIVPLLASKDGQFKGVSFLPLGDEATYPQQPYEKLNLTEKEIDKKMNSYKSLGDLYAVGIEADGDKFCDSDTCSIL